MDPWPSLWSWQTLCHSFKSLALFYAYMITSFDYYSQPASLSCCCQSVFDFSLCTTKDIFTKNIFGSPFKLKYFKHLINIENLSSWWSWGSWGSFLLRLLWKFPLENLSSWGSWGSFLLRLLKNFPLDDLEDLEDFSSWSSWETFRFRNFPLEKLSS